MVSQALAAEFRRARAHQFDVWAHGGGTLTTFPSGRTELTFASAPFGLHAVSAFATAKRALFFRAEARATLRDHAKRSRAAKKAWKARRANAGGR
jgi:hypothetical protein